MIEKAVNKILDENTSVAIKNRCIFYLRSLDNEEGALALQKCITGNSILLDHEIAYVLGQMRKEISIPFLINLFKNSKFDPIVRHEAIEALGNYKKIELIEELEKYKNHEILIIKESIELAIEKIKSSNIYKNISKNNDISKFGSRDPAFPMEGSFEEAKNKFINGNICEKYRAMFYLRDLNNKESVEILGEELIKRINFSNNINNNMKNNNNINIMENNNEDSLLRHEIAYVFGQMENEHSIKYLKMVLEDNTEADVVRHEAAEALGNIGNEECRKLLEKYLKSDIKILSESCAVGLEIAELDEEEYFKIN